MDQTAYKPGSVPPPIVRRRGGHSSGPPVAGRFSRPTRTPEPATALPALRPAQRPYSVLLRAGLAMPSPLPGPRWALTPPFHPCLWLRALRAEAAGGLLSVALSLGSPPAGVTRRLVAVEPGLSSPASCEARATARPSGPTPAWPPPDRRSSPGRRRGSEVGLSQVSSSLSRAIRRARVSPSATLSMRLCRQWRWKARTTTAVAASKRPVCGS